MSWVRNLHRDFGDFHIHIPEWEIADQGITALVGPSGSGKTTVFRVLLGLEPCPELSWEFQGEDLAKLPPPQRRLGVVFQSLELFPHMSAEENIFFAAEARGIPRKRAVQNFLELKDLLQLTPFLARRASVLSGGERQRVALARALMGEPRFLFLDEPFSSLDQDLKKEARNLLMKLMESRPTPTLLITHDPEDLQSLPLQGVKKLGGGSLKS